MTVRDELNRAGPVLDGLNAAIRENPLAAGLIGAGVAWMLFGGAKGFGVIAGAATGAARMAGSEAASAGTAAASGVTQAGASVASGIKAGIAGVADTVAPIVPDLSVPELDKAAEVSSELKAPIGERMNAAATTGREYGAALQSKLSESLDRQPLLLGAIGLAIGAGIASTFATTALEKDVIGEKGTAARETLQQLASEVKDRAWQVASDMKDEAERQGLTVDTAKTVAGDIAEKVKQVANAAGETVTQRFSK